MYDCKVKIPCWYNTQDNILIYFDLNYISTNSLDSILV